MEDVVTHLPFLCYSVFTSNKFLYLCAGLAAYQNSRYINRRTQIDESNKEVGGAYEGVCMNQLILYKLAL